MPYMYSVYTLYSAPHIYFTTKKSATNFNRAPK